MKLCSRIMRGLLATLFVGIGVCTTSVVADAADISVKVPTERAVYQRDYSNVGVVNVQAECPDAASLRARVVDGSDKVLCEWTTLTKSGDLFEGALANIPAGGWYVVEFQAYDAGGTVVADSFVEKVGVGEVFITGGQSNSANFAETKMSAQNDTVSALNAKTGEWIKCDDVLPNSTGYSGSGGSPWPSLGDALVDELGVPVGFVSTGKGNTKISELGDDNNVYPVIKEAINSLKPYGCRAFLIHQGEADESTDMTQYKSDYEALIQKTRDDFGFNLCWIIARVSYAWNGYNNTARMEEITGTQASLANNYDIFVGPTTDDMLGDYRSSIDHLHMSEKGLVEHARRWADVIIKSFCTPYSLEADASVAHGKIEQCGTVLYGNQPVKLTAVADEGYYLVPGSYKVTDAEGNEIELNNDSFVMRAKNLKVTAKFEQLPQYMLTLGAKIKEVKALDLTKYQADGVTALKNALAEAEKVYANVSSTQAEADKALSNLDAAVKALKENVVVPPADNKPVETAVVKVGDVIIKGMVKFRVTSVTKGKLTVSVAGLSKKNATSAVIPKTVSIKGAKYSVTAIDKKAFSGATKLKKLTVKATAIKSVGKGAFNKVNAKIKVKVPANKLKVYKKLFVKGGLKKAAISK